VIPGLPHHVTQRGNGRAQTFFCDGDYRFYRDLLASSCRAAGVEVWAWVLMPNHVHLILVPPDEDALRRALAPVHKRYAATINARLQRTGHFWQGRFGAVVMDEPHLAAAVRYVAQNPVRAGLSARPEDWMWSSVHAHLSGTDDGMTVIPPILNRIPRFAEFIGGNADPAALDRLRRAETIGRPLGDDAFITHLEDLTRRILRPAKRGPKPKPSAGAADAVLFR
jgi:putative transposase